MSGGSGAALQAPLNVDDLCNLIFTNTQFTNDVFRQNWHYHDGSDNMRPSYFLNPKPEQTAILNSVSRREMTPLFTACRNHSSTELIRFLIQHTKDLNRRCGLDQNTAAHAVAYGLNRSIEDKIKILKMFNDSGRYEFKTFNNKNETVWDLLYETENIELKKTILNTSLLDANIIFNKYKEQFP